MSRIDTIMTSKQVSAMFEDFKIRIAYAVATNDQKEIAAIIHEFNSAMLNISKIIVDNSKQ